MEKIFVDKISFQCLNHICHFRNQKLWFSVVLYHLEGLTGPFTAVTYFICEKVQLICSRNVQKDNIATPLTDFTETVWIVRIARIGESFEQKLRRLTSTKEINLRKTALKSIFAKNKSTERAQKTKINKDSRLLVRTIFKHSHQGDLQVFRNTKIRTKYYIYIFEHFKVWCFCWPFTHLEWNNKELKDQD